MLLFAAGLLSLKAILPGEDKKPGMLPPVLVVTTTLAFLFMVFSLGSDQDMGAGSIMVMIFGILQLIAVVAAYLLDAGIVKMPAPNPYGHQPPGGMYPPSGQFQQPGRSRRRRGSRRRRPPARRPRSLRSRASSASPVSRVRRQAPRRVVTPSRAER